MGFGLQAEELKLRARRRIGEITLEIEKLKPEESGAMKGRGIDTTVHTLSKKETLKDAGINQRFANRCEKVAEIPNEKFEQVISTAAT